MKYLIILLLTCTTLTAQSSLETSSHAIKYGYTLNLANDTIVLKSKQEVRFVDILGRGTDVNIRHHVKQSKIFKLYVGDLNKGHYLVVVNIKGNYIVNIYNHKIKSRKP